MSRASNTARILALTTLGAATLGACTTADDTDHRPGLVPLACGAAPVTYLLDDVQVPRTPQEPAASGLDLDGDDHSENVFAQVLLVLGAFQPGFDVSSPVRAAVADGRVAWALSITTCGDEVRVDLAQASDADGDGRYVLTPVDAIPAAGTLVEGRVSARDGRGAAPAATLADGLGTFPDAGWTTADALALEVDVTGDTLTGTLAFAFPIPDARRTLVAPIAAYFSALLQSGGSDWAAATDANHDGVLSVDEFLAPGEYPKGVMENLFEPDVALYGPRARYGAVAGRAAAAMSVGLGIHAHVVATESL
ncbi:MAG: hypothetical protein K8W52_31535 [Deltaproteobacteria bacterium]|nr:hypothetical protein [Deltaproteobacteria bacterium]